MIDTHCHLEQPDYDNDREKVIDRCRKRLQALITCCAHPNNLNLTMSLVRKYNGFVYASTGLHPQYVKNINDEEVKRYFNQIRELKKDIVAIGETGLDYNWVKESVWQQKQKDLFIRQIKFAKKLGYPIIIHSRDAIDDTINILESCNTNLIQMHMFTSKHYLKKVVDNGWMISINTLSLRSKNLKKIIRDCPLKHKNELRNEPTSVELVVDNIAKIKKIDKQTVDSKTTKNAQCFFKLDINKIE